MLLKSPVCESVRAGAPSRRGAVTFIAGVRAVVGSYFVCPVAFAVATALTLWLDAPPSHAFYILWGAATLIGAAHGSLGQGVAAGLASSALIKFIYPDSLSIAPADPGAFAQSFAFLLFALLAGRLNAVRAREARTRRACVRGITEVAPPDCYTTAETDGSAEDGRR